MNSMQTTLGTTRATPTNRPSRSFKGFASLAAGLLLISACGQSNDDAAGTATTADATAVAPSVAATTTVALANIDEARIINADAEPGNWMAHGRTYDEQRHSPLTQISDKTVKDLGLAWYWDTETTRGLEASPIVVDGIMYSTGSWSVVWAHNAKTGELLWKFDPEVPRSHGVYACCDVVNRGAAVWKGRVYVGTIDGRLIALNAEDGTQVWSEQTTDRDRAYTITGAPRVIKGSVIIGNGGAEYGVRGYITAYDANTGEQQWRFYTVPGNPDEPYETKALEEAAKTWRGDEYWKVGGGGTVWDSMAYDPELNTLYIGVGNGSPWNRYIRSPGGGDNLYLSSIVALNPDTGEYKWHYQTTPGDNWDYTATQHMILADMEIGGVERKVIMQAPKNGFFYVIDRENGQFISAEAYVPVQWATHIDPETGRPVESPDAQYANDLKTIQPGPLGGHNWHPMTYSPKTNLVYIPALGLEFKFAQNNAFKYDPKTWNLGIDFNLPGPATPDEIVDTLQKVKGHLAAWDPVKQEEVWRVQHDASWNGGLLSTSGNLLFQGLADGTFTAYTADTGEKVWSSPVHIGIIAPPISYMVDGEQYIAVVAGWGGAFGLTAGVPRHKSNTLKEGRILAYKLGGKEVLPEPKIAWMELPEQPKLVASADELANGQALFNNNCQVCHGAGVISSTGGVPDLRYMSDATHESWDAIVRGGAYTGKGMVSFAHVVDEQGSKDLHAYVVSVANASIGLCETEYRKNYPELLETACVKATPVAEVSQQEPKAGASR